MFDKEYSFKGQHAEKVIKLTAKFDEKNQLFKRNLDVYLMAPIVGFLYNSKAPLDTGETTKIFPQQLTEASEDLLFNYRLIMLLNRKKEILFISFSGAKLPSVRKVLSKTFPNFAGRH